MLYHADVVGDEEIGQSQPGLQVLQHIDDLGLDRHVQRGDRLVTDDEFRIGGEGAGNADTLALAAGELVGVAGSMLGIEADDAHQLPHARLALILVLAQVVHVDGLGHDVGHRHARI